ncbi:MAG: hypothetical protein ACLVAW_07545 [Eisenbergiella massiliensis]
MEAKAAQSSIEDDATAMVKKHFGKSEGKTRSEEASMKTTGVTPEKKTENTQNENHGKQEQVQTAAAQFLRRHSPPLSMKAAQPMRR